MHTKKRYVTIKCVMKNKKYRRNKNITAPKAENANAKKADAVAHEPLTGNEDAEGKETSPEASMKKKCFFGKLLSRLKMPSWLKISAWSRRTKIIVSVALVFCLLVAAVGLTLGLTLPIKEVTPQGRLLLLQGETYRDGLELVVVRKSGKVELIAVKDYMMPDLDTSQSGEQTVTVYFQGRRVPATVLVLSQDDVDVRIREGTLDADYELGAPFPSSGVMDIYYADERIRSVPIVAEMVSGFSTEDSGTREAAITFFGVRCTFTYKVMKEIDTLEIRGKVYAPQGEKLTPNALYGYLVLAVTYTDGTTDNLTVYDPHVTLSPTVLSVRAESYDAEVAATYRGIPFRIAVVAYPPEEKDAVSAISVSTSKTVYSVGERFDISLCTLRATYKYFSGAVRVPLTEEMVTIPGGLVFENAAEELRCVFEYAGCTASITLRVIPAEDRDVITSVSTNWLFGSAARIPLHGALDYTDATLTVYYGNGYRSEQVPITPEMLSGFRPDEAGVQSVTISYEGATVVRTVYVGIDENQITGISVYGWSDRTFTDDLNLVIPSDAGLSVIYGFGARSESLSLDDERVVISGFVPGVAGTQHLTVDYRGFSCELTVHVLDDSGDELTLIRVKSFGKEYTLDDPFDPDLCKIELGYSYGKRYETVTLTEFMEMGGRYETGYRADTVGSYLFEIYILSKIDEVVETLYAASVVAVNIPTGFVGFASIAVNADKARAAYAVGEEIDLASLELTVSYSDATTATVPVTSDMVVGFTTDTPGAHYAQIYYQGSVTEYEYFVVE